MKLTNVSFAYGDKVILDRFSLELPDEGITALAGPSGCGKTTLLRLLAGLATALCGTIDAPADTALLFQEDRLLPGLTAAGQIGVVLPKGESSAPWLEAVGLADASMLLPEELSGGMRRRAALARCLAYGQRKKLLLLDEPFTGMDPDTLQRAAALLRQRCAGKPVLLATHDESAIRALGWPVVELEKLGRS